jgi:methylamine dehydrogenase accessory protein MauD
VTTLAVSNALLWVVLAVLAVILLALVRQLGIIHERLAPIGTLSVGAGLKVGERAPALELTDLAGGVRQVASPRADGKSTLLLFLSPTCPVCKTLLPLIKSSARLEEPWLEIWLAGDGEADAAREFAEAHGLGALPYLLSAPLAISYQVSRLPYAVVIDGAGVLRARAAIENAEQLSGLLMEERRAVEARNRAGDGQARHQAA